MLSHRNSRNQARRDLHLRLAEPVALYVRGVEDPILTTARWHDKNRMIGDLKGTSFDFALRHENTPELVFLLEEFTAECNESFKHSGFQNHREVLARGTIARFEDEPSTGIPLAFEIDNVEPVHGITINAFVTFVREEEACVYQPPSVVTCPANT